jgi:hypothetical protein
MKKEFVDFLYDLRNIVQDEIDRLYELNKQSKNGNCQDCGDETEAELRTRRSQIQGLNQTIEKYFETHTKNI